MSGEEMKLLRALHEWREHGEHAILVTVVKTWPRSPWPEGSMMVIRENGTTVGQVAGGCVEADLVVRFLAWREEAGFAPAKPAVVRKLIEAAAGRAYGVPTDAEIVVLLEFDPHPLNIRDIVKELECRELVLRRVSRRDGSVTSQRMNREARLMLSHDELVHPLGPVYRMLLIGAGPVAEALATLAKLNGFEVTLCEPRGECLHGWSVGGIKVIHEMPTTAIGQFAPDARSCVMSVSGDPLIDEEATRCALYCGAFHVGGIADHNQSSDSDTRLRRETPPAVALRLMAEILSAMSMVGQ
ncbi:XdhC family protein [Herbaspirillum sp. C9C3]|uniref:XdhC family protein n=1 Tax=Herbaspirillum sp. C9C3 TaxID=2735271 RepID=UPI0015850F8D|nr:XdhC family protein [Herbaspirillum sp. C9C3]NUT61404.1 XdhC family protein [Herbaspirillum sp. C9C3]